MFQDFLKKTRFVRNICTRFMFRDFLKKETGFELVSCLRDFFVVALAPSTIDLSIQSLPLDLLRYQSSV